ncbi:MAG: hypothetical protein ACI3VJ_05410 [Hominicoprocola sp.]
MAAWKISVTFDAAPFAGIKKEVKGKSLDLMLQMQFGNSTSLVQLQYKNSSAHQKTIILGNVILSN